MLTWHTFDNYGYVMDKVPSEVMDILRIECERYRSSVPTNRDINLSLAGQINKEHSVKHLTDNPTVLNYLNTVRDCFIAAFNPILEPRNVAVDSDAIWSIELSSMWLNVQERGEYNPVHKHGGAISFVIWYEIPYNIEDEKALDNSRYSNSPTNGDFSFCILDVLGNIKNVPMNVGKHMSGTICLFHADTPHFVSPFFTTDKQRITFSGNFAYKMRGIHV